MQNIRDIEVAEFLSADFLPDEILDAVSQKGDDVEQSSELPKYITNYIGSKQKLIDWIWQNTPEDVKSVFDAFGGSNVVGFLYKRKGLKVFTNDQLKYSFHISRAIIENNSTKLSEEEIDKLIIPKSNAGDFIQRNFKNTFFTLEVLNILDGLRENINTLKGYKKDIALFALGKTCITGKGGFGHFSSTTMYGNRRFTKPKFLEIYKSNLKRISDLVFDNGQDNKAYNGEILDIAPEVKADLAYFDPPYATHFSTTNYETAYHFVEGLMTMWKGKEIKEDSKTKTYEISSKTVTEKTANEFFENYLNASKHIKYWIISYRDNAYPSERKIKTIIDDLNKDSRMKSRDHHYSLSSAHGENSDAKEHIFICGPRGFLDKAKAKAETEEERDLQIPIEEDFLFALAARRSGYENKHTEDKTRVSGYMGSKYFVLDWIWRAVPKEIRDNPKGKVFFDAFCGGANVAYFFKQKGFKVITNDSLDLPTHIARAVIENNNVTLTEEDVEDLLKENKSAGDFVVKTFHGYYYTKPILEWLDNVWANIQNLKGYKKDLALSAMGATVKAKALFGEFKRSKKGLKTSITENKAKDDRFGRSSLGNLSVKQFEHTFKYYVKKFNSLVFDNSQENKVYKQDAWELIPKIKADLAYFDPPYVTEFEANDYENAMHFVEGLMTMWKGKEIQDNVFRNYKSTTKYSKTTYPEQFQSLIGLSQKQYPNLLISYRNHAYPTKREIKSFLKDNYKETAVKEIEVEYRFGKKDSKAQGKYAKELLFTASNPLKAKKGTENTIRNRHATLTCDAHLNSKAKEGDPQFTFILTHAGTNSNGDHFLASELKTKHETIVEKKIDLKHSQDITDIVGGVISSDYKDKNEGVVECVGELYVQDNPHAQLAYKLLKKGIIKQVSMECDYEEGECSICKKRVKSRSDDCIHLKKYKGKEYRGKKVYEILHNITFTGLGLLDRAGADEKAKILTVATQPTSMMAGYAEINNTEDSQMSENNDPAQNGNNKQTDHDNRSPDLEAKYKDQSEKLQALKSDADQKDDRIKELESELDKTAKDLEKAQKLIESMEKEKQAAKQKAKAESLLKKWESMGRSFDNDKDREKELNRLAGLSEDTLGAIEETVTSFEVMNAGEEEEEKPEEKNKTQANRRANADTKPEPVDDADVSLTDQLKNGFIAAYNTRIGG